MLNKIKSALTQLGIELYQIEQVKNESLECFFVRKNLDLKRSTSTEDYTVTVYCAFEKDGRKLLGSSQTNVYVGMEDAEITEALKKAAYAASLAGNPYYELYEGKQAEFVPSTAKVANQPLEKSMEAMVGAIYAEDTREDVFINSVEVFIARGTRHIVSSAGVDVSFGTCSVTGEYIVQCPAPQDVETMHPFSYADADAEALRAEVKESIEMTRARAQATTAAPTGEYPVIISGGNVATLMRYYLMRSDASLVYQKISSFQPGDNVQGEDIQGDKLTLVLKAKDPYSNEGIPMEDRTLIENGQLKMLQGATRFARYLGIEPTGSYRSVEVPVGSTPLETLKSGKYLHVITFSSFDMNPFTGYFGGEIRLAFLCDGETVTPVTGGSISGSLLEAQKHMTFSAEKYESADYTGPFAVKIEGVSVAGA